MTVTAATPGVFWSRPEPDANPFCVSGDPVSPDTEIGFVEVMKMFVPVDAGVSGVFDRYLLEDGALVDAGDALAEITEAS